MSREALSKPHFITREYHAVSYENIDTLEQAVANAKDEYCGDDPVYVYQLVAFIGHSKPEDVPVNMVLEVKTDAPKVKAIVPVKRGRGRPKGSTKKAK